MYFYVDESGHTGPNIFDEQQPMLYYGSLSSHVNLDLVAKTRLEGLGSHACTRTNSAMAGSQPSAKTFTTSNVGSIYGLMYFELQSRTMR